MASSIRPLQRLIALFAGLCLALLQHQAGAEPPTPTVVAAPPKLYATVNQVEGSKFPRVVAYVTTADDSGAPINGLGAANFEMTEDGLRVTQFEVTKTVNTQERLAVALVLDISGSMDGKSIDYARQAATSFLDILGPSDVVELISFSDNVKVNIPFTTTKSYIARGIENLRAGGNTALYDAVATTVENLAQLGPGRKVAVLLTDGEDTKSKMRLDAALALVSAKRVPVFTVGLGNEIDRKGLDLIAQQSGGSAIYAPSAVDLSRAYRILADQLRSQYTISFASGLKADGKEHRLSVHMKQGAGTAEGQGIFVAQQNPPWMDIVAPRPRQIITSREQIEVSVQPSLPEAKITKVDFAIDGQIIASKSTPPYVSTISAVATAPGGHVLKVTATDSAGNTTSREIDFSVAAPTPTPQATATPSPTPSPRPPPPPPPSPFPTVPVLAGVSFFLAGGVVAGVAAKKRRQRDPHSCRDCGTVYSGREDCPTCALEDRRWLRRRLREIVGRGPDEEPPRGGSG